MELNWYSKNEVVAQAGEVSVGYQRRLELLLDRREGGKQTDWILWVPINTFTSNNKS